MQAPIWKISLGLLLYLHNCVAPRNAFAGSVTNVLTIEAAHTAIPSVINFSISQGTSKKCTTLRRFKSSIFSTSTSSSMLLCCSHKVIILFLFLFCIHCGGGLLLKKVFFGFSLPCTFSIRIHCEFQHVFWNHRNRL
ncbi:hypothetical protein AX774_g3289 [Zancudomyces culisetae]|uniref:Secreted protein n=1 Tax=Zancudomyces culisetae TaxID=1213189 RepID=A0A1R1PQI1_ZANCU|nr:hypothetical protein AX774_g3289 [Zancudomyces culisetae]|eukprot:OMH83214.1 hypothetical protein AX774_g3289 [Zancudomyces culisetae]